MQIEDLGKASIIALFSDLLVICKIIYNFLYLT